MPITPKTKTIQFRVESDLFDKFSREVDYCEGASVSSILRSAMHLFIKQMHQRRKTEISNAEWAATLESRRKAAAAASVDKTPPGASVRVPASLSERRKAEKIARAARKAKE